VAQHEAKFIKTTAREREDAPDPYAPPPPPGGPGGPGHDPHEPPRPAGSAKNKKKAKKKKSGLYYVMMWFGLVVIGAAVIIGITMLPKAKDAVVAVTSRAMNSGDDEDDAEAEAAAADSEGDAEGETEGVAEVEQIEIPVEVQTEEPDEEELLESQPAAMPEGVKNIPAPPEVDIGTPVMETVASGDEWVVHKMAPQETVDQVAYRYGVKPGMLRMWNGVASDKDKLRRGARLKVKAQRIPPPRRRAEYIVQPGDTWQNIASHFGIDSRALRQQNWEASKNFYAGVALTLWIDPLVYYSIKYDPADPTSDDPVKSIRRGAVGVGPPQNGRLINGVQIPEGEGYTRRMMPSSYGTTHAVSTLLVALRDFEQQWPYEPDLVLGSMSVRHGGPLEGHVSHQSGRDLDVRLPLDASVPPWFPVQPHRVDYKALWFLFKSLADTGEITIIFLDYEIQKQLYKTAAKLGVPEEERRAMIQWPRGQAAHRGLVRHARGHDRHFHVRFRCGPYETECVERGSAAEGG